MNSSCYLPRQVNCAEQGLDDLPTLGHVLQPAPQLQLVVHLFLQGGVGGQSQVRVVIGQCLAHACWRTKSYAGSRGIAGQAGEGGRHRRQLEFSSVCTDRHVLASPNQDQQHDGKAHGGTDGSCLTRVVCVTVS